MAVNAKDRDHVEGLFPQVRVAWRYAGSGFPSPIKFGGKTSARHWWLPDLEAWETKRERALNPVSGPRSQRKRTAGKSEVDDLI